MDTQLKNLCLRNPIRFRLKISPSFIQDMVISKNYQDTRIISQEKEDPMLGAIFKQITRIMVPSFPVTNHWLTKQSKMPKTRVVITPTFLTIWMQIREVCLIGITTNHLMTEQKNHFLEAAEHSTCRITEPKLKTLMTMISESGWKKDQGLSTEDTWWVALKRKVRTQFRKRRAKRWRILTVKKAWKQEVWNFWTKSRLLAFPVEVIKLPDWA